MGTTKSGIYYADPGTSYNLSSVTSTMASSIESAVGGWSDSQTLSGGGVATPLSGWSIDYAQAVIAGRMTTVTLAVTRTGGAITVPANGNIGNQPICTLTSPLVPAITCGWGASHSGRLASGDINTGTRIVSIGSVAPGSNISTGEAFSISSTYIRA